MADEPSTVGPVVAQAPTPTNDLVETTKLNGNTAPGTEENGGIINKKPSEEDAALGTKLAEGEAPASATDVPTDATLVGKDKKRKSTGGVPEHKIKKLNKKKSIVQLRLDCKPGQFYWARLKGYPPWPSVICDESMLPESLLATRPVSTARPDGTIRADFDEGGKNAKERTFPIMFLSTNEFQWMINTSLSPLDPEEVKSAPTTKLSKSLQDAYRIASEDHDLQYFKNILLQWQEETEAIAKAEAAAQAEADRVAAERAALKAEGTGDEKPKKKAARKSKGSAEDEEMADADAPASSKKRKKGVESDAETPKPKKTPKVTKLNAPKTPNGEESAKKTKPKKKLVTAPKPEEKDEPQSEMSEAERYSLRQKTVLYLRHRLQKGFLTRDKAPAESEMADMDIHLAQLETYQDLEVQIISETKIHKVLKGIVKLASVPRDEEFGFKKRSSALLKIWNQRIDAAGDVPAKSATAEKERASGVNGEPKAESAPVPAEESNAIGTVHGAKDASIEDKNIEEQADKAEEQISEKTTDVAPLAQPPDVAAIQAGGDVVMK